MEYEWYIGWYAPVSSAPWLGAKSTMDLSMIFPANYTAIYKELSIAMFD